MRTLATDHLRVPARPGSAMRARVQAPGCRLKCTSTQNGLRSLTQYRTHFTDHAS